MREIAWRDLADAGMHRTPVALTIGVFDGLHIGHRSLISAVTADPARLPVVVTFARHPAEVLAPERFPGFIMSPAQKREGLGQAGVGLTVLIDFSPEFAQMSGAEFMDALLTAFDVRFAAIGHDFRCGHEMSTDAEAVRRHFDAAGVQVTRFGAVTSGEAVVSSTRIRGHIRQGSLRDAARLLGRPFALDLTGETETAAGTETVIPLDSRGLLPSSRQLVPAPGRYAATAVTGERRAETMITVEKNSLRLPLAAESRIRYIVLQDNRVL